MYISKMQIYVQVLLLLVLGSVAIAQVKPSNKFEEGLLKVLDKCKEGDVKSLPVPFPSLKSLKIPSMKSYYDGFTMSLRDVHIEGLNSLIVQKLSASPSDMTLSLKFVIPTVAVRADQYHLHGKAFFFINIDDKGIFKSQINNVKAQADVRFGAKGKDTVITDLHLKYSVSGIQVHLSGSSKLVNSGVNEKMSMMINDSEVKKQIRNIIIDMVRKYLRGHTPQEFVKIISAM